jgi:hypothetical protein
MPCDRESAELTMSDVFYAGLPFWRCSPATRQVSPLRFDNLNLPRRQAFVSRILHEQREEAALPRGSIDFFQIGAGIAGDFPRCIAMRISGVLDGDVNHFCGDKLQQTSTDFKFACFH